MPNTQERIATPLSPLSDQWDTTQPCLQVEHAVSLSSLLIVELKTEGKPLLLYGKFAVGTHHEQQARALRVDFEMLVFVVH